MIENYCSGGLGNIVTLAILITSGKHPDIFSNGCSVVEFLSVRFEFGREQKIILDRDVWDREGQNWKWSEMELSGRCNMYGIWMEMVLQK